MIRVKLGSVYHYGIFSSEEEVIAFGLPPLPEYRADGKPILVLATDIDTFSCGEFIEKAVLDRKELKKRFSPEQTLRIARSRIGEGGYNLIHNNCEHFVYECVFGEGRSTQEEEMRARYRARPIFDIYLAVIPENGYSDGTVYPEKRRKEIEKCSDSAAGNRKSAGWELLREGSALSFDCDFDTIRFKKSLFGKWTCDQFFFSIAYTDTVMAVVLSNAAAGVDLESDEHFRNVLTPADEKGILAPERIKEEMIEYTGKQAAFKCSGRGRFDPKRSYGDSLKIGSYEIKEIPDLVMSVCGANIHTARFFYRKGSDFVRIRPQSL